MAEFVNFIRVTGAAAMMLLFISGCDGCGDPAKLGTRCSGGADCRGELLCIDGMCVPPAVDAGPEVDAGPCVDLDGDGYGEGPGCLGPDCNDSDPRSTGVEVCDELDNDCDGEADEGYELCGGCVPGCSVETEPAPGGFMLTDDNHDTVIVDDDGAITLGRENRESFSIWVANQDDATVSKLDSRTNTEIARYPTVGSMAPGGARPWNESCNWSDRGNCPSRTAVDQNFDAYVANRAFGNQGTVTKYANDEADCVDRNSNGMIETSRDLNGDGIVDTGSAEFVGVDDECILWTVGVGGNNGVPRALAVGLAPPDAQVGNVWVGLFNDSLACELNPDTGATIECLPIDGYNPYGAVADMRGRIWFAHRGSGRRDILGYIDASTRAFTTAAPVPDGTGCDTGSLRSYGVTTDADGLLYVAMSNCSPSGVLKLDPEADAWTFHSIPGGGTPRGVAADTSSLWVGISHNSAGFGGGWASRVEQYSLADMSHMATHAVPSPGGMGEGQGPVGVGVSFDGSIWAVCQGGNHAARLDPTDGSWIVHPVGSTPYTYSDFIGFGLNTFADPRGWYRFTVEGCEQANRWLGARYTADIPVGTSVELWARTGATPAALGAWIGPFTGNPADFEMAPGPLGNERYLEVEIRLSTDDRTVAPRVFDIAVAGACETLLE